MKIEPRKKFNTISKRIIFGINFMYSEFIPIQSEMADEESQLKLHKLMQLMIDKLYVAPELLDLGTNTDEAFDWYATNNSNTELDAVYKSIFKSIYNFYKFLYIASLYGDIKDDCLSVDNKVLSSEKARYTPLYKTFLCEFGINIEKSKTQLTFLAERDVLQSLKLLAEKVPVNVNRWTPYALINFVCCSFTGNFDFLLKRIDYVTGLNGLLFEIETGCANKGYVKRFQCNFGQSVLDFSIYFENKVGGFVFGYNPRKYWQFYFGSMNSIGIKAMLEDFESLDNDVQKYLIRTCKTCSGCLGCTKGGKTASKIFAVKVSYGGKDYTLCNDTFSLNNWETLDRDLVSMLFKYHDAQEIYGSNWKKK